MEMENDGGNMTAGAGGSHAARWKRYAKPAGGVIGLLAIIAYSGGWFGRRIEPGPAAAERGEPLPPGAATADVVRTNLPTRLSLFGTTASEARAQLSARIPATIREVLVSAGERVTRGQTLVTLDDRELQEQLAAAEAQFRQADAEYQRTRQLFEKNAATQQALTAAESASRSARAQLDRVNVLLSYTRIAAPFDGVVTDRRIEAGDLAGPGQPLLAVYDPARMRIEVPAPVRLVDHLKLGQEAAVALDRPARTYRGRVTEIVSEIDPQSRTQTVKVRLEDAAGEVLPGTFGRVEVDGAPRETLLAPAAAIERAGQLELARVVEGGRAVRRLVTTGAARGEWVEVLSGLRAGERVVVARAAGGG